MNACRRRVTECLISRNLSAQSCTYKCEKNLILKHVACYFIPDLLAENFDFIKNIFRHEMNLSRLVKYGLNSIFVISPQCPIKYLLDNLLFSKLCWSSFKCLDHRVF